MIVVYTTILGGSDSLKLAPVGADRCVCIFDDASSYHPDAMGWEYELAMFKGDPRREAWRMRCIPHFLFPEADKTVWIDASFSVTNLPKLLADAEGHAISAQRHQWRENAYQEGRELIRCGQSSFGDIDRQFRAYQGAGYPEIPLHTSSCLVRENSPKVTKFNETWDAQIQKHPGDNTQVSLDYSAWVHGLTIHDLKGNRHVNPYWTHDAKDHRLRRKPYRPEHVIVR